MHGIQRGGRKDNSTDMGLWSCVMVWETEGRGELILRAQVPTLEGARENKADPAGCQWPDLGTS